MREHTPHLDLCHFAGLPAELLDSEVSHTLFSLLEAGCVSCIHRSTVSSLRHAPVPVRARGVCQTPNHHFSSTRALGPFGLAAAAVGRGFYYRANHCGCNQLITSVNPFVINHLRHPRIGRLAPYGAGHPFLIFLSTFNALNNACWPRSLSFNVFKITSSMVPAAST